MLRSQMRQLCPGCLLAATTVPKAKCTKGRGQQGALAVSRLAGGVGQGTTALHSWNWVYAELARYHGLRPGSFFKVTFGR